MSRRKRLAEDREDRTRLNLNVTLKTGTKPVRGHMAEHISRTRDEIM